MTTIRTTVVDRRIAFAAPVEIADGTEVIIELNPVSDKQVQGEVLWDNTPSGIADWIKWYNSLDPLVLSPQEVLEIERDRQARRQFELAHFDKHADRIAAQWQ